MSKMFEGLSIYDFQQQFGDDKSCIDMLCEMKWSEGYSCRSCGYMKYCGTKRYGERRCNKCRKPESATAHTLFHKVKFPIYLDEYVFKFNRHKMHGDIFNVVLMRMTHHRPMTAKEIFRVA